MPGRYKVGPLAIGCGGAIHLRGRPPPAGVANGAVVPQKVVAVESREALVAVALELG